MEASSSAETKDPWEDARLEGRLLSALMAHSGEWVYVKDREGRYRLASKSLLDTLGFRSEEEILGKHDTELFTPELADPIVSQDRVVLEGGGPLIDDELSGTFEETDWWTTSTKLPLRDERGDVIGLIGISQDLTTRRVAEHALSDRTERLHTIVATQRDVATAGLNLRAVMELLCRRTMELTAADGATVALLKDGVLRFGASSGTPDHPIGEVLDLDSSFSGRAIRERRALICNEARTDPRVDRERVEAAGVRSMVAVPLLHAGKPVGTLLVLSQTPAAFDDEDMRTLELLSVVMSAAMSHAAEFQAKREQVEALTRFRTIFEGASVGIVRVGPDGRALQVNAAVLEMLGYSLEEHATLGPELFTHPDDLEVSRELLRQLMTGARDSYEQDKRYIHKDGEVIWVHVRAWMEPRADGEPPTAIAMIENITERKLAEIALRENNERLARVVDTQRDIAAAGVDLEGVMQLIVERSQALTVAEGAIVSLIDGEDLVVGAACGVVSRLLGSRRPLRESVAYHAFQASDTVLIEHAEGDSRLYSGFAKQVRDRSHICVPLFQGDRPVAALNVMTTSETAPRLGEDDRRTLELLAVVLASAVSRAAEFEAKRRQVETLARFEATYTGALAGIMTIDPQGSVVDTNPAIQDLMGYSAEEFAGTRAAGYVHPDDREKVMGRYEWMARRGTSSPPFEYRILRKGGDVRWVYSSISFIRDAEDRPTLAILMVQDVTQRKAAEEALLAQSQLNQHQARHDALTGLANRTLFRERIERAIAEVRPGDELMAVLLMDLDRFKEVNDSLGHHAGDELLQELARRLSSALRTSDAIARLGGDEFGVLLTGLHDSGGVIAVVEKLVEALEDPITVQGLPLVVEASIGIALFPDDGTDVETLLRAADVAMYTAKEEKAGYGFFDGNTHQLDLARLTLVGELRRALEKRELVLHYQPQAVLADGRVHRVEALLRWDHPERGRVGPAEFIPLAQQTGLIKPLTLYVIGEALGQCRAWRQDGLELEIAVNVSTRNLLDAEFPSQVLDLLNAWELEPAALQLEITEDAMLADPVRTKLVLERLAGMGVRLAIDDFGTGYSSLAYLKRLPIEEIKIDRSFVIGMEESEDDATIVRSTIDLGRNLGLKVVAEGVETQAVWNRLCELGCTIAQGYFLSHALPADELRDWMLQRRAVAVAAAVR
jgi:diguanylate cyclase (GGDEF)-like protein/PAS domain S-box-containing protein